MTDGFAYPHKDGGLYHRPYGATRISQDDWQETDGSRNRDRPSNIRPILDVTLNPEDNMMEWGKSVDADVIPIRVSGRIDVTRGVFFHSPNIPLAAEDRDGHAAYSARDESNTPEKSMGLYATQIFPRLMDWVMARPAFSQLREALLQPASGEVLEIGFGTGLNLRHYPATLTCLSIVDPAMLLPARVARRTAVAPYPIQTIRGTAEDLPFPDRQFETVVSTWTLCTISDPVLALQEVGRVLKPGGTFLFLEHGRSDDQTIAAWQDRLNPIQNVIGCGCNLNRRIDRLITQSGLTITYLNRFNMQGVPRLVGEMYQGTATRHH